MRLLRASAKRGFEDKGWLKTYHTFSFDTYYDPDYMGYRAIRVINEDELAPGKGFGAHSHKDMEIITYVLEGALEHRDSLGNTSVISKGEVQRMTAGTGINHSEYNLSHQNPVHFLQIWIQPNKNGLTPSYAQKSFSSASKWAQWCLLVSNNGRGGSLTMHQDAEIYATLLESDDEIIYEAMPDRFYWLQVVSGSFVVQEVVLKRGDSLALDEENRIAIKCLEEGELLLFDLA